MLNIASDSRPSVVVPLVRFDRRTGARVDRYAQAKIATELRAMYDDLLQQSLPDRFVDLLAQLDASSEKDSRER